MGQYYRIVNLDKRQQMIPEEYGNGFKLMEWAYNKNLMVHALMNLMANRWKGDRVYVVGDYADLYDPNEPCHNALRKAMEEIDGVSLYRHARIDFERVLPEPEKASPLHEIRIGPPVSFRMSTADIGYRYIYNHALRQVVDLRHCPVEWIWYDEDAAKAAVEKVAPLPLLIAVGNGRGGGDYQSIYPGYELVGSWCDTVTSIEITKEPLRSAIDYSELIPNFTEHEPPILWTAEESKITEYLENRSQAMERDAAMVKHLTQVAEDNGWSINLTDEGGEKFAEFEKWSPAGEDIVFSVAYQDAGSLAYEVAVYADNFDAEEHVREMLNAKRSGFAGIPGVRVLVEDADAIETMLRELADALKKSVPQKGDC